MFLTFKLSNRDMRKHRVNALFADANRSEQKLANGSAPPAGWTTWRMLLGPGSAPRLPPSADPIYASGWCGGFRRSSCSAGALPQPPCWTCHPQEVEQLRARGRLGPACAGLPSSMPPLQISVQCHLATLEMKQAIRPRQPDHARCGGVVKSQVVRDWHQRSRRIV